MTSKKGEFKDESKMKKMRIIGLSGLIFVLVVMVGCRSTPQKRYSTWKTFELHKDLKGDYDKAWEAIVKASDRMWGVQNRDRDTGHIETGWIFTDTNVFDPDFRRRFIILLQPSAITFKIRSESQSRDRDNTGVNSTRWRPAKDSALHGRTYHDLVNEIGRTVLNE